MISFSTICISDITLVCSTSTINKTYHITRIELINKKHTYAIIYRAHNRSAAYTHQPRLLYHRYQSTLLNPRKRNRSLYKSASKRVEGGERKKGRTTLARHGNSESRVLAQSDSRGGRPAPNTGASTVILDFAGLMKAPVARSLLTGVPISRADADNNGAAYRVRPREEL